MGKGTFALSLPNTLSQGEFRVRWTPPPTHFERRARYSRSTRQDILAQPTKQSSKVQQKNMGKIQRKTLALILMLRYWLDQLKRQRKIEISREKLLGSEILATKYQGNCALKNSRGYPVIRKIPNEEIVHARSLKIKTAKELHCNQDMKSLKIPSSLFHFTGTTRWKCIQHDKRTLLIPDGHV